MIAFSLKNNPMPKHIGKKIPPASFGKSVAIFQGSFLKKFIIFPSRLPRIKLEMFVMEMTKRIKAIISKFIFCYSFLIDFNREKEDCPIRQNLWSIGQKILNGFGEFSMAFFVVGVKCMTIANSEC